MVGGSTSSKSKVDDRRSSSARIETLATTGCTLTGSGSFLAVGAFPRTSHSAPMSCGVPQKRMFGRGERRVNRQARRPPRQAAALRARTAVR